MPNSGLPSAIFFSPLSAPTLTSSNPASTIPNFDVSVSIPATGRVTYVELYYTTSPIPTASDWSLLSLANTINGQPINPGSTYVFANQVLPTGSSTSKTYYFSYIVGNNLSESTRSAIGTSFTWTPVSSGKKNAEVFVYTWATTIPTISGSSTYTWSTDAVTSPPSGWFTTISDTATDAQTLWKASVLLEDSASAVTTNINWSLATIVPFGYAGTTGAVSRIAYTATTTTLNTTPSTFTVSNDSLPATGSWGAGIVWSQTTPTLSAGQSVWQSDGVYNPTTNKTIWSVPYLSSLKIGNLSAISTNTGSLTVSGNVTIGEFGNIRGGQTAYNTGTCFFLGYSGSAYKFSIGNSTTNMTWDGSAFTLNNAVLQGFGSNSFKIGNSSSGNLMFLSTPTAGIAVPLVFWDDTSASAYSFFQLSTNSKDSTSSAAVTFNSSGSAAIALIVTQTGSGGGAAKFFNTASSKEFWLAPGAYSAYSPSGGGKIYVVDGNGPFTGFHDTLNAIDEVVELGDIMVDVQLIYKAGISNTLFETSLSSSANQQGAIGVVSGIVPIEEGTPGALWICNVVETDSGPYNVWSMPPGFDEQQIKLTYKVVQVNALGEGQINVCGENGNIQVGDYIVTSSIAGKGMKQSDDVIHSYTVAKAREAATFSSPTEVKMIACIYVSG